MENNEKSESLIKKRLGKTDPTSEYYVEDENLEVVPVKGTKFGLKHKNGVNMPMFIRNLSVTKSMQLKPDDTFVIGYPKSGKKKTKP